MEVIDAQGNSVVYPDLTPRIMSADVSYINRSIGVQLEAEQIAELLAKMSLAAHATDDKRTIVVSIPPTRSDILHPCDIMEDVAVAYGFNNIIETTPKFGTVAIQQPVNKLSDQLRREVALAGYTEILPFTLVSLFCRD